MEKRSTRGHPLVCGGLACSLMEECARAGVEYRVYGSVSSMDTLGAFALHDAVGGLPGQQALDYSSVFSGGRFVLDTSLPAVIYFNATVSELSARDYARFCARLEDAYSQRHPCYFYGRSFTVAPDLIELRELRKHHGRIDPSFTLLIPAR